MEPEKKSRIRFLLLAVVAAFVFLFTLAYIGEGQKQGRREAQAKIVETRALVVFWADALSADREQSGLFIRYQGVNALLPENDGWDNLLSVEYTVATGPSREFLSVRSYGPDGKRSGDDIIETRMALKRPGPEK